MQVYAFEPESASLPTMYVMYTPRAGWTAHWENEYGPCGDSPTVLPPNTPQRGAEEIFRAEAEDMWESYWARTASRWAGSGRSMRPALSDSTMPSPSPPMRTP